MVFSSLLFLFMYLPVVLVIYYVTPRRWRNLFLFIANLIFYGWGEPVYVSLMIFSTVVDYTCGRFITKYRKRQSGFWSRLSSSICRCSAFSNTRDF